MKPDIHKLRRFALSIALALITYSLAVVEFAAPLEVRPLGIPMTVNQPVLLPIALVLASVYSSVRFYIFAVLGTTAPWRGRARLLGGKAVSPIPADIWDDPSAIYDVIATDVAEYFPGYSSRPLAGKVSVSDGGYWFDFKPEPGSLRWGRLVDIDYLAPIWANVAALVTWALHSFTGLL